MKFSLITTVYNNSPLLRKFLISLQNQSLKPNELIISDDGSSEDILSVIKSFNFNFPITFISQTDLGFRLSRCRNNAVRQAKYDILIFIDQDIILTKNFIETMIKKIRKNHFVVGLPIRLTKNQSKKIDEKIIKSGNYYDFLTNEQKKKIVMQYRKDKFYYILKKNHLIKRGVKLRGGLLCLFRKDYFAINGYDENYKSWGAEDDDFGYRLNAYGIIGINPFIKEFALHLYHSTNMTNEKSLNLDYLRKQKKKINKNFYTCKYGINSPKDKDKIKVIYL